MTSAVPKRFVAYPLLLALVLPGCARRAVPPIGFAGAPFEPEADERLIWAEAEEEEEKLQRATQRLDDPLLLEYLARIGDRLTPAAVKKAGGPGFEIRVLRDPTLNAFAMPNGTVYLHTGLLSRVGDEAQLALILGHEMTHVTNRHALEFQRNRQGKIRLGFRAEQGDRAGAAVRSQTAQAVLGLGLELAALAAIQGYGRELEREADAGGLEKVVAAGYDPSEATKVFALLGEDAGDRGALETFFLGTRPRLGERLRTANALLQARYASVRGEINSEEFALRTRTVVRDNALLDVHAGRFRLAQAQLDRVLALTPRDPTAHLYYGDLYRLQAQRARSFGEKESLARQALREYRQAADLDPAFPDPFRQLALLYYQQRDTARAKEAFQKYLALKPDAPDAKRIREYLIELDR